MILNKFSKFHFELIPESKNASCELVMAFFFLTGSTQELNETQSFYSSFFIQIDKMFKNRFQSKGLYSNN